MTLIAWSARLYQWGSQGRAVCTVEAVAEAASTVADAFSWSLNSLFSVSSNDEVDAFSVAVLLLLSGADELKSRYCPLTPLAMTIGDEEFANGRFCRSSDVVQHTAPDNRCLTTGSRRKFRKDVQAATRSMLNWVAWHLFPSSALLRGKGKWKEETKNFVRWCWIP